jgi:tRNA(Ile)-lysidine synthase
MAVTQTIESHRMLEKGATVLVTVSGGPDSMALLHVLMRLKKAYSLKLGIAHVNHMLRAKDSDRDAAFVERSAAALGLFYHSTNVDIQAFGLDRRLSLEEAGRVFRYDFFKRVAENNKYSKIALGHQSDDNAEQILMNILRGAGPKGLSGIPPKRNMIIRPLIELQRSDIIRFLKSNNIQYVLDRSNFDLKPLRNRIRNLLIPDLASKYNPQISRNLNQMASIIREDEKWLSELVVNFYAKALVSKSEARMIFSRIFLKSCQKALVRRILRQAFHDLNGTYKELAMVHTDQALRLVDDGPEKYLHLPGGIQAYRSGENIIFEKTGQSNRVKGSSKFIPFEISIPSPGNYDIDVSGYRFIIEVINSSEVIDALDTKYTRLSPFVAFMDADKVDFPLTLRNPAPGDRFRPLGCRGTQKLKKFFIDHKVLKQVRERCPILIDSESIVWVVGFRIDDSVKVTTKTESILKITAILKTT